MSDLRKAAHALLDHEDLEKARDRWCHPLPYWARRILHEALGLTPPPGGPLPDPLTLPISEACSRCGGIRGRTMGTCTNIDCPDRWGDSRNEGRLPWDAIRNRIAETTPDQGGDT